MTWNLWWRFGPWEERQPAIDAVVAAERPDVMLLQEVWTEDGRGVADRLAGLLGASSVVTTDRRVSEGGVGFHNGIVSRWPIEHVEERALPGAGGQPGHRRILLADIATPWGPWPFAVTHLDYQFDQSALRCTQVAAVLDAVVDRRGDPARDLPVVLGGDFNAVPDSDEIRMVTGRSAPPRPGVLLGDSWDFVGDGPGLTWRRDNPYQVDTAWPQRRLDYVFVSWPRPKPVGNPVAAHLAGIDPVEGVVPSDHAAVVVDLQTPSG